MKKVIINIIKSLFVSFAIWFLSSLGGIAIFVSLSYLLRETPFFKSLEMGWIAIILFIPFVAFIPAITYLIHSTFKERKHKKKQIP